MPWKLHTPRIWAAALLLAVAGSAASTWQIMASREAHLHAAERLVLSLSNAAAQRIAGSLRTMDVLLADAAEKISDPAKPDELLLETLRGKLDAFPELDSIGLIDTGGILRQSAYGGPQTRAAPRDVSQRAHIRYQQVRWRENDMFVSPPDTDHITGKTFIFLSRPIIGPDQTFVGIASLAVHPAFIDEALSSVVPNENGAAVAFSPDGLLFMRQPHDDRFNGASIAESSVFKAYNAVNAQGTATNAPSFADGVERIVGFTPVPHYPVVVAVGISRDTVLGIWRHELLVRGGIQSIFIAIIFALALRLSRSEQRRQIIAEQLLKAERAHVETLARAVDERTVELNDSLDALSESEERFRRMVEISPLPLVLTRRTNSRVVYINACAAEAFALTQDVAVDLAAPDYWVEPADRTRMVTALAAEGQIRNLETKLKRSNGECFTALLSAASVTLRGEDMILCSVLDISERKRLEDDLARSNRDLEQFSYAVSHDLQEPLRMVSSYLALLERRYRGQLDEQAHEFIFFAVDGAQRMSRMITDLLEYSRVHRRGNPFTPVMLDDVLADALANLSTAIAECGAEIIAEHLPTVFGDASQLMRVFQNLIGNALKYRAANIPPRITVSAVQNDGQWVVSVGDNGIGIDPGHADRLFQIFQRLHARGAYEGTGVGLALCRRILERHGGRVWVDSAGEGLGSTFRFALPLDFPGKSGERAC